MHVWDWHVCKMHSCLSILFIVVCLCAFVHVAIISVALYSVNFFVQLYYIYFCKQFITLRLQSI